MEPIVHKVNKLLKVLPTTGIQYGFCYGSSLFASSESKSAPATALASKEKQIDLVLVLDDQQLMPWHAENMARNPQHYASYWRALGPRPWVTGVSARPSLMERVQRWGPGLWYHPYVTLADTRDSYKYGVVSRAALVDDLQHWSHLYLAGRLHKPVLSLHTPDAALARDLAANQRAAVAVTALLLAASLHQGSNQGPVTCREFYAHLSGLSYRGDIRMGVAESPDKIARLVGSGAQFDAQYRPTLEAWGLLAPHSDRICLPADLHPLIAHLPASLRSVRMDATLENQLHTALTRTVARSSRIQTIKGLLTAGPARSVAYSLHKIRKRFF